MLLEIVLAVLICAFVLLGIWLLRGMLLTPVSLGKGERLTLRLEVSGAAAELESTVSGLLWLSQNGTLCYARLYIIDCGMDEETRQSARILARADERVCFEEWQTTDTQKYPEQFGP